MTSTVDARAGMPRKLAEKLESIERQRQVKKAEQERELAEAGYSTECVDALAEEAALIRVEAENPQRAESQGTGKTRGRGMTTIRMVEQAQQHLFRGEQLGLYTQFPVEPNSEYPSILARVPIFLPGHQSSAKAKLDKDLALPFATGWGEGRKMGPLLSIYDEDTLLALLGLRQKQLVGMGNKMPIQVMDPLAPGQETQVQALYTTISAIEEWLESKKGGRGYKKRLESVRRLDAVVIQFTRISDPSVSDGVRGESFSTKLIDLVTKDFEKDSCLYVQFPPLMVRWLAKSYTHIEMDIRRQLTDNGKAIHKFLASQKFFNMSVAKLRVLTGSGLDGKNFMRSLQQTMGTLADLGWCEWEIEGNGRRYPYKLTGKRLKKLPDPIGQVA